MTRNKLILIAIFLIALVPVLALAGDGPRGRGMGPGFGPGPDGPGFGGPGFDRLRHFLPPPSYLDLDEEQIAATEPIRERVREELGALGDQHRALREELHATLEGESPDPTTVGQLVIDLHALRPQFRAVLESADAEFSAILTEEQLQKWENFKELRQGRRQHRGERMRHRRGRGPGGPGPDGPSFDG